MRKVNFELWSSSRAEAQKQLKIIAEAAAKDAKPK